MPILAQFLGGLFASLAGFLATYVTKKAAFGLSAITTFGILTVALMAAISTLINGVLSTWTLPQWFLVGFNLFMPPHFVQGIAALIAGHTAVALYKWNVENLKLLAYVT